MKTVSYRRTLLACYLGYVTQAISINLYPLLFVTFQREFSFTLEQISLLVSVVFITQITVDTLSARFARYISYRTGCIAAHVFAVAGLVGLSFLPDLLPSPYVGVLLPAVLLAIGGGLIETIISPVVESMPGERKDGAMSLLHSFYCWGFTAVTLLSTLFFVTVGIAHWRLLVLLWALLPLATGILFALVPMPPRPEEGADGGMTLRQLCSHRTMWLLFFLMICSGAAELAPAQWASLFAESGLGVSKTAGDLLGPCAFACLQGLSRVLYSGITRRFQPRLVLLVCSVGCVLSYLLIVLAPHPFLSLAGFGLCGVFVGPMWPGVLSLSAARYPRGGTAMFGMLALGGDIGCILGPAMVGVLSDNLQAGGTRLADSLKIGMALCALFPLLLTAGLWRLCTRKKRKNPVQTAADA